jgi:multiple sugar transport system permease protein/putative aldouronate transport system permease protein
VQVAFRDFNVVGGITGSPWVGLKYFDEFIHSYNFWTIIRNTIEINVYQLAAGFPLPIILAIALNYVSRHWFRRPVQMITYAPHFISTVVMVGIILMLLDPRSGIVNVILQHLGLGPIDFMGNPDYFKSIYVWSGIWQNLGFNCIIYLAALTSVDPTLHEAAMVDGASKLQRIWHVDLPGITPIMVILFILDLGSLLSIGFEKVLLLQNPLNIDASEVIGTYTYRIGLASAVPQFSYAAAIGLFQSVVGLILIVAANQVARRARVTSLW